MPQNSIHICFPLFLSNQHRSSHCLTNKNKEDCELLLQMCDISHHHWYFKWFSSASLLYTIFQNGTHRNILLYKIKWLWICKSIFSLLNISHSHGKIINWPRPKWGSLLWTISIIPMHLHTKLPEWKFTSSSDLAGVGSGKAWRLSLWTL